MNSFADVEALIELNSTRKHAVKSGYKPQHLISDNYLTSGVHHYNIFELQPGKKTIGTIKFITPEAYPFSLWTGKEIPIQEGNKVVGTATITKIYNKVLDKNNDYLINFIKLFNNIDLNNFNNFVKEVYNFKEKCKDENIIVWRESISKAVDNKNDFIKLFSSIFSLEVCLHKRNYIKILKELQENSSEQLIRFIATKSLKEFYNNKYSIFYILKRLSHDK